MRNRRMLGVVLAATVLAGAVAAGGAVAGAGEPDDPIPTSTGTADDMVELPTGDQVRLRPGGGIEVVPAAGREDIGFIGQAASDGTDDVVVVPEDRLDAVQGGTEDPRRYNVSRLLADGHTDAAAVPESELDDREYAGLTPVQDLPSASPEAQPLDLTVTDRSGAAPDEVLLSWFRADTGELGDIEIGEDGTGTVELEPGDYLVQSLIVNYADDAERGETVYGYTAVSVGDEPAALDIDAAEAAPIAVKVERDDAELDRHLAYVEAEVGDQTLAGFEFMEADTDAYLLPDPDAEGFELGFLYQPVLTGGTEAEPYTYTLAFGGDGPMPEAPAYNVADAELATERTEYQSLGADLQGSQCDFPTVFEDQFFRFSQCLQRDFPSKMTNYYSPTPVQWDRRIEAGVSVDYEIVDGYVTEEILELDAGPVERVIGDGPLTLGIPYLAREADMLDGGVVPVASHAGESLWVIGYDSSIATLSRDGEEIGRVEDEPYAFAFDLPEGDQGRYTLTVEAARPADSVVEFGVESAAEWRFDSETAEFESLDLPVVLLEAEGVQGGWADAEAPLEVALTLASETAEAKTMALEVSYDDGQTWTEIELDDGAAVLEHPSDAEYASVRLSATDTAGSEVTHTTIRSFGLR